MAIFTKETPPSRPAAPRGDAPAPSGSASVVSRALVIDGKVGGDDPLTIEGTVKGSIDLRNDLRIGAEARVEATVHARNVVVEGTVVGDLSAENRIELVASAVVEGNLQAPKIVVSEGARFRGSVDMGSKANEAAPRAAAKETKE